MALPERTRIQLLAPVVRGRKGCLLYTSMVIYPCTGNTEAKLANGIVDTPVLLAAKAHLRHYRDTYQFSALLSYTFVDKDHEGMESVQGPYYHTVVCACCSIVPDGYNTVAC